MQKDRIINGYITRAIIEANLQASKETQSSFSLVKFAHKIDLEDTYGFKDFISFIHINTDFSPILYQENDSFLIFLKDTKILDAKTIMKKLNRKVENLFNLELKHIGITSSDPKDTYQKIMDRVDKYFVMSKFSSKNNMFYGTVDFDFYDTIEPAHVIRNILKKSSSISLHNIYKGIPITEEVKVSGFNSGIMQIRLKQAMVPFYQNETFTFIRHDLMPDVIKADIIKVDQNKMVLVLGNLKFMPSSPVERSSARIIPTQKIHAILSYGTKKIMAGHIASISENSISMELPSHKLDEELDKSLFNKELNLQFQFITTRNFLSLLNVKAYLFDVVGNNIIFSIMPGPEEIERIKHYITLRQNELLSHLKMNLLTKKR